MIFIFDKYYTKETRNLTKLTLKPNLISSFSS